MSHIILNGDSEFVWTTCACELSTTYLISLIYTHFGTIGLVGVPSTHFGAIGLVGVP